MTSIPSGVTEVRLSDASVWALLLVSVSTKSYKIESAGKVADGLFAEYQKRFGQKLEPTEDIGSR